MTVKKTRSRRVKYIYHEGSGQYYSSNSKSIFTFFKNRQLAKAYSMISLVAIYDKFKLEYLYNVDGLRFKKFLELNWKLKDAQSVAVYKDKE